MTLEFVPFIKRIFNPNLDMLIGFTTTFVNIVQFCLLHQEIEICKIPHKKHFIISCNNHIIINYVRVGTKSLVIKALN